MKDEDKTNWYLAVTQNFWGRGNSPEEAINGMNDAQCYDAEKYVVYKTPAHLEKPYVTEIGYLAAHVRPDVPKPESESDWDVVNKVGYDK